ncbi:MAG TPA: immunoglobulin domain-containing protein, partial [Verrucomicrobiae bacterium]|nr:immunoglobulin domain-containing protein [Verrucomicrobiae bacterium]
GICAIWLVCAWFTVTTTGAATNGTWTLWASHPSVVSRLKISPAKDSLFVSYVSGASTYVFSNSFPVASAWQLLPGCDGITNRVGFDILGIEVTKQGNPIIFTSYNPTNAARLYTFDPAAGRFVHPNLPQSDEARWNQTAGAWVDQSMIGDHGDVIICGGANVYRSSDGLNWTIIGNGLANLAPPPPYQSGFGVNGQPSWLGTAGMLPGFNSGLNWHRGVGHMPWGELLWGGERPNLHSLDGGATWVWLDPMQYQPVRDNSGQPMYPNPGEQVHGEAKSTAATLDGEILIEQSDIDPNYYYTTFAADGYVTFQSRNGMPSPGALAWTANTMMVPGLGTVVSPRWVTSPSPSGNTSDLWIWDCSAWTRFTPANPGGLFTPYGFQFESDGASLYTVGSTRSIYKWTPDFQGVPPPTVQIQGGTSSVDAPTTTMDPNSGLASAHMQATVTASYPCSRQWVARGPMPVLFSDPHSDTPTVFFSCPGDYVLNLKVWNSANGQHAGNSVIVHVLPASGGAPPNLPDQAAQPQNTLLNLAVPTTFSVNPSGSGPFRFQWRRNGTDVVNPSSQTSTLTVTPNASDDGATYYCVISSPYGRLVSNCGFLGHPPVITAQTANQVVPTGMAGTLSVACSGSGLMFWQWFSNGVPISTASPATQGNLVTTGRATYTVIASNALGASSLSAPMTITDGSSTMFTVSVSQGIQGDGSYAVGTTNIPIAVPAYYASADYPVFDHWNPAWMGGITGVTCTIANPRSPQTVAKFSGNLANLAGASVSLVPIYRTSKARLTVVNGLGSGHYDINIVTNADITALPPPPGYQFARWESTAAIQDPLSSTTRVTLTNGPTLVNALYAAVQPTIQNVHRDGNDVVVQWTASSGLNYTLQTSPTLGTNTIWSDVLPTNRPGPNGPPYVMGGTNPAAASASAHFYRVRVGP